MKGFSNRGGFLGFTRSNFGQSLTGEAYGYSGVNFWLDSGNGTDQISDGQPVSFWRDRIQNITFLQGNSSLQPILVSSDVNFGGNPTVNFSGSPSYMVSSRGSVFGAGETFVYVYQYYTIFTGSSRQMRIFGDLNYASARTSGIFFGHGATNNSTGRPYAGSMGIGANAARASADLYLDLNPVIVAFNQDEFFYNGASVPITGTQLLGFTAQALGGPTYGTFVGNFKLAEFLKINRKLSTSELLDISNKLNLKYSIY